MPDCSCCLSERRKHEKSLLPVISTMIQNDTAMLSSLSLPQKTLLVTSNIAYCVAAAALIVSTPVATPLCRCFGEACTRASFHAAQVTLVAAVSTYWHGAQVQLQIPCCRSLYCYKDGVYHAHSPSCQEKLVVADIACACFSVLIGIVCFGVHRTLSWLSLPILIFTASVVAKARRNYHAYVYYHSLWHVMSAIAIFCIVCDYSVMSLRVF